MTQALETAVVQDVQAIIGSDLQVLPYPDDVREFTLSHPRGAVLVTFAGRAHNRVNPSTVAVGVRRVVCDLVLVCRALRAHAQLQGLYDWLDALEGAYVPGRPVEAEGQSFTFFPVTTDFVDHNTGQGTWIYALRIEGFPTSPLEGLRDG